MASLADTIDLYAELALVLAGFAGVASTFSGRERRYRPVERLRLDGVLIVSASVLGACMAYKSAAAAALSEGTTQSVAALVGLILMSPAWFTTRELWQRARDPDAQVLPWSLRLVTVAMVTEVLLLAAAVAGLAEGWPLVTCFSLELIQGLWLFFLLLTREN